jgi:hypothetical protein
MSNHRTLALLLLALPLVACQGASSTPSTPSDGGGPTPSAPSAALTIQDPTGGAGPFALDDLERLTIGVQGRDLGPGSHIVRLDVVDPSGTLYAQLPAGLALPGSGGTAAATVPLQVHGTSIETFRQVGTWQVAAWVDGAPLASASVVVSE